MPVFARHNIGKATANSSELSELMDEKVADIVRQVWSVLEVRAPQVRPGLPSLISQLSDFRPEYEQHLRNKYQHAVRHLVEVNNYPMDAAVRTANRLYETQLGRDLDVVNMGQDLPSILQDLIPDPHLMQFDAWYANLCDTCAERIAYAERHGQHPTFSDPNETPEDTANKQQEIIQGLYDALLPRSRALRKSEYEDAMCVIRYMRGEGDLLPIRVANSVSLMHTAWSR